ncbi:hypothetical protein ACH4CE_03010 [Streptomyces gelaticus]|uniref:hypothetical protein n=1 Tax=Streptomyces gelaticus TaxID=285446 RepID=UPI0037974B97
MTTPQLIEALHTLITTWTATPAAHTPPTPAAGADTVILVLVLVLVLVAPRGERG